MKAYRIFVLLAALALAGGGCGSFDPSRVTVKLDKSWYYAVDTLPSIEVDIVGVGANDVDLWKRYSMTRYWSPRDRLRTDAEKEYGMHIMRFGHDKPLSQTLESDDPIWDRWYDADISTIFILVNLDNITDREGDADPRRSIFPVETTAPNIEVIILPPAEATKP